MSGYLFRLLVLVSLSLIATLAPAAMQINTKGITGAGLRLLSFADPAFPPVLKAISEGSLPPVVEAMLPYAVIVTNGSPHRVVVYALRWSWLDSQGREASKVVRFTNVNQFLDVHPRPYKVRKPHLTIEPMERRLISPLFNIGEGEVFQQSSTAALEASASQIASLLRSAPSLTIALDAAVLDDGSFWGADLSHTYSMITAMVTVRQNLFQAIVNAQDDAVVNTILNSVSQDVAARSPISFADFYSHFEATEVRNLQQVKRGRGGVEAVRRIAQALLYARKPAIHKP